MTKPPDALERRYALRVVTRRLHQHASREAVIAAYGSAVRAVGASRASPARCCAYRVRPGRTARPADRAERPAAVEDPPCGVRCPPHRHRPGLPGPCLRSPARTARRTDAGGPEAARGWEGPSPAPARRPSGPRPARRSLHGLQCGCLRDRHRLSPSASTESLPACAPTLLRLPGAPHVGAAPHRLGLESERFPETGTSFTGVDNCREAAGIILALRGCVDPLARTRRFASATIEEFSQIRPPADGSDRRGQQDVAGSLRGQQPRDVTCAGDRPVTARSPAPTEGGSDSGRMLWSAGVLPAANRLKPPDPRSERTRKAQRNSRRCDDTNTAAHRAVWPRNGSGRQLNATRP